MNILTTGKPKKFTRTDGLRAKLDFTNEFDVRFSDVRSVGSCYITNEGNDTDLLAHGVKPEALTQAGFIPDVDYYMDGDFTSYRRGDINVILTQSREYFISEACIAVAAHHYHMDSLALGDRDARVEYHASLRNDMCVYVRPLPDAPLNCMEPGQ